MGTKDKIVLGIGIMAMIAITTLIVNGSNECFDSEAKAAEATANVLLRQKDVIVAKLIHQVRIARAETTGLKADLGKAQNKLDTVKDELSGATQKIENIREEVNAPIAKPSASKK